MSHKNNKGLSVNSFLENRHKVSFPIENASKNASKNAKINNIKLNSTQEEIIKYIYEDKYITQEEISIKLKNHASTIQRNMKKLQEKNIIFRVGSSTKGYWEISKKS